MSRNYIQQLFASENKLRKPINRKILKHQNFSQIIDLKDTLRGVFIDCFFKETSFNNFDCTDYYFNDCKMETNKICNSSFDFLGMVECDISSSYWNNSSFNHSIVKSLNLNDISIQACNFQGCIISNSNFNNITINCSDFKGSVIENCIFDTIEMKETDLQFIEFRGDVTIQNSSFLLEDILHCFNGISMVEKNKKDIFLKLFDESKLISGEVFLASLEKMIGYFVSIYDYFSIANIMIFLGDKQSAFEAIMQGIKYSLAQRDFKLIRYLCKLASISSLFNTNNLKQIYNFLKSNSLVFELSQFEYKRYIYELNEIKQLLLDNPTDLSQLRISIVTTINEYDYKKLSEILKMIDDIAISQIPQTSKSVTIRHNSSPIIEILLNDSICLLIPYFTLLCAVVGKSIKYIDKILDLVKKHEEIINDKLSNKKANLEITNLKLSNQLKEIELKKAKYEYNQLISNLNNSKDSFKTQSEQTCVNSTYISNISYNMLYDYTEINEEFRQMQIDFNIK